MASTRSSTSVWLVGNPQDDIIESKLPSNQQVLSYFFYLHHTEKKTIRDSARLAVEMVMVFWVKARIPVQRKQHCIEKLEGLFVRWKSLQKHRVRGGKSHEEGVSEFQQLLPRLFDIAHAQALEMISIQEDKDFLIAQRDGERHGCMGAADVALHGKEKRAENRRELEQKRQKRHLEQQQQNELTPSLVFEHDEPGGCRENSDHSEEDYDTPSTSKSKRPSRAVSTPALCTALDRAKLSSRDSARVVAATVQSLGHNIDDFAVSSVSLWQSRRDFREKRAADLKAEFRTSSILSVHWDGKLLPDICGKEVIDRLPIILSEKGVEQLLGAPKLSSGTGTAIAEAVFDTLEDWTLSPKVKCMGFDTTSSITGIREGACTKLEAKLERKLLNLANADIIFLRFI